MSYAIRIKDSDDFVRELSEYINDNRSDIKTFKTSLEAENFAVQNNLDEDDYVIEKFQ